MKIDARYLDELVIEWKNKYGSQIPKPYGFSPINILAFRKCSKHGCSIANTEVHRHHMGYESFLARIYPDVYAPRYLQFHKDDIALVCEKHHKYIHEKVYHKIVSGFMAMFYEGQPTIEDCENLRKILKKLCIKYLNKGNQNVSKKMERSATKETQGNVASKKSRKRNRRKRKTKKEIKKKVVNQQS